VKDETKAGLGVRVAGFLARSPKIAMFAGAVAAIGALRALRRRGGQG